MLLYHYYTSSKLAVSGVTVSLLHKF